MPQIGFWKYPEQDFQIEKYIPHIFLGRKSRSTNFFWFRCFPDAQRVFNNLNASQINLCNFVVIITNFS